MIPLGVLAGSRYVAPSGGGPTILTSDSFNRADGALNGSYSDAALGGTPLLWYNNASYVIESNQLRSTNYLARWAAVHTGVSNMSVSATVVTLGAVSITASGLNNDARSNRYAAVIGTDGALTLEVEYAGTTTLGTASAGTVTAGSVVTLTNLNKDLDVSVNGVSVITATDSVSGLTPGAYAGIRSSSRDWRFDDFKVEEAS